MASRGRANIATQVVEDIIGTQKTSKQPRECRRFRRPEACMAVCLEKRILGKRHRYTELKMHAPLQSLTAKLPMDAFKPTRKFASPLDIESIAGPEQNPRWWSPPAITNCTLAADLWVLAEAKRQGDFALVDRCWLGSLCDAMHGFAVYI